MTVEVNRLCVIGAGAMGTGIAQVAAQAGIHACLLDPLEGAIAASQRRLEASLGEALERGKLTETQAEATRRLIAWEEAYDRLKEADWVIEAVFEDMAVKRQVLEVANERVREDVPVATNTSTFRVADLARLYGRPARFLGLHFFNPPPAMKLVEVIPGEETLPAVTAAAMALCERLGKTPLRAPDLPGFVVNRAFAALVAAAIEVWAQGGDAETIDRALELGLAHRLGPLRTADLVGLDLMLAILRSLHEQTGHPRFEPPEAFVALVGSGRLGRKSGEGFYRYDGGTP